MLMPADEPDVAPPRVSLKVDTDGLGDGADESMKAKINEVGAALILDRGFVDATEPGDPRIVIVVERAGDVENPGFAIGYLIETGDEVVPGSARQSECSLCTRTEVVELIERDLPELLALARGAQVEPVEAETDNPNGTPTADTTGSQVDTRKLGPLGFAGIGVAVLGVAGVGAGAGLMSKGLVPVPPSFDQVRDYRVPGAVVLAVGGTALIAGVVMIVVDVSKRKRSRAAKTSRIAPYGLGVAF
jgi:hypothetical protein